MSDAEVKRDRARLRVCLVKQKSTYDLYTKEVRDLRALVSSSNWRSGPLALWEAFDCEFRLVDDDGSQECRFGESHWSQYVEGWKLYDETATYSKSEDIDWSAYDIVISIDVAVPTRVVRRFPEVMWCYYWIEGGPYMLPQYAGGSPRFSYNVFMTHRLAKLPLSPRSREVRRMLSERRAVLHAPYYLQSSRTLQDLYPDTQGIPRTGICLSAASQGLLHDKELAELSRFGDVRRPSGALIRLLEDLTRSKYFVVHPSAPWKSGNAVIEAVSAGCLALAPRLKLKGYPELVDASLDFDNLTELLAILDDLERHPARMNSYLAEQRARIDRWCFDLPVRNLSLLFAAFSESTASLQDRQRGEKRDLRNARWRSLGGYAAGLPRSIARRLVPRSIALRLRAAFAKHSQA